MRRFLPLQREERCRWMRDGRVEKSKWDRRARVLTQLSGRTAWGPLPPLPWEWGTKSSPGLKALFLSVSCFQWTWAHPWAHSSRLCGFREPQRLSQGAPPGCTKQGYHAGTREIAFQASMANHIKGDLVGSALHCCHMFCPVLEWCCALECIHASPNLITRLNPLSCSTPLEFTGSFLASHALFGSPSQANTDAQRDFYLFIYFQKVLKNIISTISQTTSPKGDQAQWMLLQADPSSLWSFPSNFSVEKLGIRLMGLKKIKILRMEKWLRKWCVSF